MNIENAHSYVHAWFHAALAEHKKESEIQGLLGMYCPEIEDLIIRENDVDLAYIMKSPRGVTLAISGTRDDHLWDPGWRRNFKIKCVDGWHSGFKKSFDDMIKKPLDHALRQWTGKLWIHGHSAGAPIGLNAAYFVRKYFKRDCELIGLCSPQAVNGNGAAQCRKEHVCATMLQVRNNDPVDNISKWLSIPFKRLDAHDYGYVVRLPDLPGLPGALDNPIADAIVGGHAPSYVNRCLQKMFMNWGKPDWKQQAEYLQEIIKVAVK